MSDKINLSDLKEDADTARSIAWQYAHPFQSVEEWNEWNHIHTFSENVLKYIEEQEDNNEKTIN